MEELSAAQLAELKAQVASDIGELEKLLAASGESSKPVDLDEPIGRLSRMDALQQQQMAVASRAAHERRLQLLRNALVAFSTDEYGYCRDCEEPIGFQRLKVRPESPFCLSCQSRTEGAR